MFVLCACNKSFLEKKPDKALLIPSKLDDFQAIVNNESIFVTSHLSVFLIATDEVFMTDNQFQSLLFDTERNFYTWEKDLYGTENYSTDWYYPYRMVFYSNVVLEGLEKIDRLNNKDKWNEIKGKALFFRSTAFYSLVSQFAVPYDKNIANKELGIPLRLTSDVNDRPERGSLESTYSQIISDLQEAVNLLPTNKSRKSEPDNAAAWGMLARIYLSMEMYEQAKQAAESALAINDLLLDYNTLDSSKAKPFPQSFPNYENPEVLQQLHGGTLALYPPYSYIDSSLIDLYNENDLRKKLFFAREPNGYYTFKGTYAGNSSFFLGLTTPEMYLIRSECNARLGNIVDAVKDLNALHLKRYKTGQNPKVEADNEYEILKLLIEERRKELILRGLRWTDLRRLNKDERFSITLKRIVNGKQFELPPNSTRYILAIPPQEINNNDKVEQNKR